MHLTDQQFVDMVRVLLGKRPLFAAWNDERSVSGGYERLQRLRDAATPDCARCGGSGYFDGWLLDETCPCTRLKTRNRGGRPSGKAGAVFR